MSALFLTENGFVQPDLCEEVNAFRRAAKVLALPETRQPARLFLLARPHRLDGPPLYVSANGLAPQEIRPQGSVPSFGWYEIAVPADQLKAGANRFEVWSEGSAMNAWTLALDTTAGGDPDSFLSLDGGKTESGRHKGRSNNLPGEYVLRVRLQEGEDPTPPAFTWEDPQHPRLRSLLEMIPADIRTPGPTLNKVHQLTAWIAQLWEYRSSALAAHYAPWDAETIIAWGQARRGQNGQLPVVMCVHYAIVYVAACQALGIPSRGAVFTESLNGFHGHFAAETWIPELQKWVFVDPNVDVVFYRNDVPLSVKELQQEKDWSPLVRFGPGFAYQKQNPAIVEFMKIYLNGQFAKLRGIWPRTDFLSSPQLSPPAHGSLAYCETGFVWEHDDELAMFPYRVGNEYFQQAP